MRWQVKTLTLVSIRSSLTMFEMYNMWAERYHLPLDHNSCLMSTLRLSSLSVKTFLTDFPHGVTQRRCLCRANRSLSVIESVLIILQITVAFLQSCQTWRVCASKAEGWEGPHTQTNTHVLAKPLTDTPESCTRTDAHYATATSLWWCGFKNRV